jgi:RND family efflux transporter MFP subunit
MSSKLKSAMAAPLLALAAVAGSIALPACVRSSRAPAKAEVRYRCPMHPTFVSDKPGNCAICGMKLAPIESGAPRPTAGVATSAGRQIAYYRHPMNASVHSDQPAKDEMGMDYVPVYLDELQGTSSVPGRAVVALTPERRQALGVQSEPVRKTSMERVIRTVGRVSVDERRLHHIHTKYEGYVEHLYVDFTGKFVKVDEPLLSIYSPELVATQQEYLLAWRAQKSLAASGIDSVAKGGVDLLEAARQRLRLWDIRTQDIARLEHAGEVQRTLDLHSEVSGYVVQKMAFHGMRITPADTLFDIADLTHLWVLVDVYESDLPQVRPGMTADLTVPYLPGKKWQGPVTYVAPTVEEKTRTVKVRVEVENVGDALKPEMFADVLLRSNLGPGLVLPESAVIRTGDRDLAFVDRGDGRLEPRDVQVGAKVQGGYQLMAGVAEGERVVTSANFLLDSESSLKAALQVMATAPPPSPAARER